MVVFNYSGKEINAKIVYYGPGLSGKTTNLERIYSKTAPHLRGKMVSMKTKVDRTLFFDFLPIEGGEIAGFNIRFLLYTVPGQVYYNATRKLVLKGADAIVFVADSQAEELAANRESLKNLRENLHEHGKDLEEVPLVIQYNKRDLPSALPIEKLDEELNPDHVPSFESVATTGTGVFETLEATTKLVVAELRKQLGQEQEAETESGGQEISFGVVSEPNQTRDPSEQADNDSSTITDKVSDVPSPGEEPSPVLTATEGLPPPVQTAGVSPEVDRHADGDSPKPSCEEDQSGGPYTVDSGKRLTIPVKVASNGKPGHVIVNLAVDVEVVIDEQDKTV
jgi:signal recognition particle receptor subunit beta